MRYYIIGSFLLLLSAFSFGQNYKTVKVDSTFLAPRLPTDPTTTSANGFVYYNTTDNRFKVYESGVWKYLFSSSTLSFGSWLLAGNGSTNPATDFLGTTDNTDLSLRTNNLVRMTIKGSGIVGIGTSTPNALVRLQVAGNISSPGLTLGAEKFGLLAITDSLYGTAIGYNTNAKYQATSIGANSGATGNYSVALGESSLASGLQTVALGRSSSVSASLAIAMGYGSSIGSTHSGSIVIGPNIASTAANQFVIGSPTQGYETREMIVGFGDVSPVANTSGGFKLRATNGSGTNIAGADFKLTAGRSTGSATGGILAFNTSSAGASGTSLNAETERMRITSNGDIGISTTTPLFKLDVNGTARVQTLPFIANRDTVVTYDPNTRQLAITKAIGLASTVHTITDQSTTGTALINATGLVFPVSNGVYYRFRFMVVFRTTAATNSIKLSVTIPTATVFSALASLPNGADGSNSVFDGWITSSGDAVTGTAVPAANVDHIAIVEGIILPSASGNVQLQFGSKTSGTTVTLRQASLGRLEIN